jgi:hypothetical protein
MNLKISMMYTFSILIVMYLFGCDLAIHERLLSTLEGSDGSKVEIYFVAPGAVGEDVIQVRAEKSLKNEAG